MSQLGSFATDSAAFVSRLMSGLPQKRRLAASYLAFVQLASIRLWLRVKESASQSIFRKSGHRFSVRKCDHCLRSRALSDST
jgi:hypothetical protein